MYKFYFNLCLHQILASISWVTDLNFVQRRIKCTRMYSISRKKIPTPHPLDALTVSPHLDPLTKFYTWHSSMNTSLSRIRINHISAL